MSRIISYLLILIGALIAIYAQAGADQNQLILIAGVVVLMLGIYRVSRTIPSKENDNQNDQNDAHS